MLYQIETDVLTPCSQLLYRIGYKYLVPQINDTQTSRGFDKLPGKKEQTESIVIDFLHTELERKAATSYSKPVLKDVSKKLLTSEVCRLASYQHYENLKHIPKKILTEEMVIAALNDALKSPDAGQPWSRPLLEYVPEALLTPEICMLACRQNMGNFRFIPAKLRTKEMQNIVRKAQKQMEKDKQRRDKEFDETRAKRLAEKSKADSAAFTANIRPVALARPEEAEIDPTSQSLAVYEHDLGDLSAEPVYYISDIHLEHQLDLQHKTVSEVEELVQGKVNELIASIPEKRGLVLIGGDTAYSAELARIFFKKLKSALFGVSMKLIAILGNHELWDGDPDHGSQKTVEEIIEKYRTSKEDFYSFRTLLENTLWVQYHGVHDLQFNEKAILEATDDELADLCRQSTKIVLGGIGFSGCNQNFNAANGKIYRGTISREEDIARSSRFRVIYEKILRCAASSQIIVLTHNPMHDWSDAPYNPNWIYISGHTHQNSIIRQHDGTTVLSDNQIGYDKKPLHFNYFTIKGWYDPFETWTDGIYQITSKQYQDFNAGRGITMQYNNTKPVQMIKRSDVYMFFREENGKLYMLSGGRALNIDHSIEYFFDRLPAYAATITAAFTPYHEALQTISKEIKAFGGSGCIHGCIVDIDFYNHVNLDPLTGRIKTYYAFDTTFGWEYTNLCCLLAEKSPELLKAYMAAQQEGRLPILSSHNTQNDIALATIPDLMFDDFMYDQSRIMRSVQYVLDQGVVRIWKDDILPSCKQSESKRLT